MKTIKGKIILITGASSGIGKACAQAFQAKGAKVFGTTRNLKKHIDSLDTVKNNDNFEMIQLDVVSCDSVKNAVEYVINKEGRIDILINNAGFSLSGAVEDVSVEDAKKQFETNFFGAMRMINETLPLMRKQEEGLIINISSVAGFISIPFQSLYSASKYALEALIESLRIEVKPFGISTVLIEPGDVNTGFTTARVISNNSSKDISPYKKRFINSIDSMALNEKTAPGPQKVAKTIVKVSEMKNPPLRMQIGFQYKFVYFLKRILPERIREFFVAKLYG